MIVYNSTTKVHAAIAPQWLHCLQTEHAPLILAPGCFWKYQVLHLLELDDTEGPTYAVQCYAHTIADYETYQDRFEAEMQQQATGRWGSHVVSFSTLMQVVA